MIHPRPAARQEDAWNASCGTRISSSRKTGPIGLTVRTRIAPLLAPSRMGWDILWFGLTNTAGLSGYQWLMPTNTATSKCKNAPNFDEKDVTVARRQDFRHLLQDYPIKTDRLRGVQIQWRKATYAILREGNPFV